MPNYNYRNLINDYVDFPVPGIVFRDISPLISNSQAFKTAVKEMADPFRDSDIHQVISLESRGFIFGSAIALEINAGFTAIRKAGKLPGSTLSVEYSLEYGKSAFELQRGALSPDHNVLIVDDVLATGGTLEAAIKLIEESSAKIAGISILLELKDLHGRDKTNGYSLTSLMQI